MKKARGNQNIIPSLKKYVARNITNLQVVGSLIEHVLSTAHNTQS